MNFKHLIEHSNNGIVFAWQLRVVAKREDLLWTSVLKNLYRWCQEGLLTRIVKGAFKVHGLKSNLLVAATQIHSDSYISLAKAMELHGMIPDRVYGVDLVCPRRVNSFIIDDCEIRVHKISPSNFWGYDITTINEGSYRMACPEKALFDYIMNDSTSQPNVDYFEELRLEPDSISMDRTIEISQKRPTFKKYISPMKEYIKENE